jgi:[protein-PII] uridylyltransferase
LREVDVLLRKLMIGESRSKSSLAQLLKKVASSSQDRWGVQLWEILSQAKQRERVLPLRRLKQFVNLRVSPETLRRYEHFGLLAALIPDFSRLTGWVQHDQYHRFAANEHILRACLAVLKSYRSSLRKKPPRILGAFSQELRRKDYEILLWTALFHDLGKGLDGDHSEIMDQKLKTLGLWVKLPYLEEVRWMVRHHLLISQLIFRSLPADRQLAEMFQTTGMNRQRWIRLAHWTLIDIEATNPQALNSWKISLLKQCTERVLSPGQEGLLELQREFSQNSFFKALDLDGEVVDRIGVRFLRRDLQTGFSGKTFSRSIYGRARDQAWVRYYFSEDREGILRDIVSELYRCGLSILEAYVMTTKEGAVYDWIHVQGRWSRLDSEASLSVSRVDLLSLPIFDSVTMESTQSMIQVHFLGKDEKGLLLRAVTSLAQVNLNVVRAQIHTWGKRVHDQFVITLPQGLNQGQSDQLKASLEDRLQALACKNATA